MSVSHPGFLLEPWSKLGQEESQSNLLLNNHFCTMPLVFRSKLITAYKQMKKLKPKNVYKKYMTSQPHLESKQSSNSPFYLIHAKFLL